MSANQALMLVLILPWLGMASLPLLNKLSKTARDISIIGLSLAMWLPLYQISQATLQGAAPNLLLGELMPGLTFAFKAEPLGLLFAGVAGLLWPFASLYAVGYLRANHTPHQTRFHQFFALSMGAAMAIAFAANLLTLFAAYELLTLATYPLVAHQGDGAAQQGARRYLGILLLTSIGLLLPAIFWTWSIAGHGDFIAGGLLHEAAANGRISDWGLSLLLLLFGWGIGKAALMPFHAWLPAAMVAPTPVSALLHAVAVVKAGVFTFMKVMLYVFGIDLLEQLPASNGLFAVGAITLLTASGIALRQDNLKRRLAYSTVSQLAYVVIGTLILAPLSMLGAALHIAAHAFGKITLFFAAGAIYTAAHKTEISQLDGIGRRMPWTMAAFTLGALSMIGVPPLAGFVSKWYLLLGAWSAQHTAAMAVITLSTLFNAAYFIPIIHAAWFRPAPADATHGEAPVAIVIALLATATMTLLLAFLTDLPLRLLETLPGLS